jgi:hypothetical protein
VSGVAALSSGRGLVGAHGLVIVLYDARSKTERAYCFASFLLSKSDANTEKILLDSRHASESVVGLPERL